MTTAKRRARCCAVVLLWWVTFGWKGKQAWCKPRSYSLFALLTLTEAAKQCGKQRNVATMIEGLATIVLLFAFLQSFLPFLVAVAPLPLPPTFPEIGVSPYPKNALVFLLFLALLRPLPLALCVKVSASSRRDRV